MLLDNVMKSMQNLSRTMQEVAKVCLCQKALLVIIGLPLPTCLFVLLSVGVSQYLNFFLSWKREKGSPLLVLKKKVGVGRDED